MLSEVWRKLATARSAADERANVHDGLFKWSLSVCAAERSRCRQMRTMHHPILYIIHFYLVFHAQLKISRSKRVGASDVYLWFQIQRLVFQDVSLAMRSRSRHKKGQMCSWISTNFNIVYWNWNIFIIHLAMICGVTSEKSECQGTAWKAVLYPQPELAYGKIALTKTKPTIEQIIIQYFNLMATIKTK